MFKQIYSLFISLDKHNVFGTNSQQGTSTLDREVGLEYNTQSVICGYAFLDCRPYYQSCPEC